jgi:hypothetical protein
MSYVETRTLERGQAGAAPRLLARRTGGVTPVDYELIVPNCHQAANRSCHKFGQRPHSRPSDGEPARMTIIWHRPVNPIPMAGRSALQIGSTDLNATERRT